MSTNARPRQSWAALTDIGRVRTHNEDSVLAQPPVYAVADGLGGHEAGEVASSIAIDALRDHAPRRADASALARAVKAGNRAVIKAAREGTGRSGMGTTMTAALVEGMKIAVAHVGDSRAYLLHEGALERLTEDHSMVADMVRRGQLTEAESRVHPHRSVITRALGTDQEVVVDAFEVSASPGDRLLLCSDGLTGMLEDSRIAQVLGSYRDPGIAAHELIAAANEAGGHDNISVVVVDIEGNVVPGDRPAGRSWLAITGWLLAVLLVVGGIGFGVYRYAETRAFLILEDGAVTIYRGVPGEVAGLSLNWLEERTGLSEELVDRLPLSVQEGLEAGIVLDSVDEARSMVDRYQALATRSFPELDGSATPNNPDDNIGE